MQFRARRTSSFVTLRGCRPQDISRSSLRLDHDDKLGGFDFFSRLDKLIGYLQALLSFLFYFHYTPPLFTLRLSLLDTLVTFTQGRPTIGIVQRRRQFVSKRI